MMQGERNSEQLIHDFKLLRCSKHLPFKLIINVLSLLEFVLQLPGK
jgi:hypothetical protein